MQKFVLLTDCKADEETLFSLKRLPGFPIIYSPQVKVILNELYKFEKRFEFSENIPSKLLLSV
jgi:hypothetical protein